MEVYSEVWLRAYTAWISSERGYNDLISVQQQAKQMADACLKDFQATFKRA